MLTMKRAEGRLTSLPIDRISPSRHQTRRVFDRESLLELADSIRKHGLLQPISVRETGRGSYELIAGERRLRACLIAGLKTIPAIVIDRDDKESSALTLIENLQRSDLNLFEEAEGIAQLIRERGITQEEAAGVIGKAQSTVANKLRLLRLPEELRGAIIASGLTERHARALLRLPEEQWAEALHCMITGGMNVKAAERLVEHMLTTPPKPRRKGIIKDVRLFFNTVDRAIGMMREAGVAAKMRVEELPDCYACTIRIEKRA